MRVNILRAGESRFAENARFTSWAASCRPATGRLLCKKVFSLQADRHPELLGDLPEPEAEPESGRFPRNVPREAKTKLGKLCFYGIAMDATVQRRRHKLLCY